jgi:FAD/FMN-containing dehydrogenase
VGAIAGFKGAVLGDGDVGYDETRAVWNGVIDRRPALIARCTDAADVAVALRHARDRGLEVTVRGGGHGVGGLCVADGALMIDLSLMTGVQVDPSSRLVQAQAGALLGQLDSATQAHGLAVPVGINTTTGLAGLTLGGGIGWLMRRYGLTIDNLVSAELVTADGELVTASETTEPELFWGLRGAGPNFGVVTSFTYRSHPVGPTVYAGPVVWALEDAPQVLREYRQFCETAPDEVTTIAALRKAPPADWIPGALHGRPILQIAGCYAGPVEHGAAALHPLLAMGTPLLHRLEPRPFTGFQALLDRTVPKGWHYYWKSHDVPVLKDDLIDLLVEHTSRVTSPRSYTLIPHLGGAVSRVDEDATAYSHRDAAHAVNINAVWLPDDREHEAHVAWVRGLAEAIEPFSEGVYVNFLGAEGSERIRSAYGAEKYDRLVALKRAWDPANVLRHNQNISPIGNR